MGNKSKMKTTIGGERLGAGNKQEVSLKNYERSTHDLGNKWRSSMSAGTLVPFMSELALPGDTWDINLDCDIKTLPTIGPLFGSYKVQLDIFECPVRLYHGKLHMNMLNIGNNMQQINLPQIEMNAHYDPLNLDDNAQINPSSIYSYLNIRGLGKNKSNIDGDIKRYFNAIPYLSYWSIFKQYYSNKQEENAYVIHAKNTNNTFTLVNAVMEVMHNNTTQYYDILDNDQLIDMSVWNNTVQPIISFRAKIIWSGDGEPYGQPDVTQMGFSTIENPTSYWQIAQTFGWTNLWQIDETTWEYQASQWAPSAGFWNIGFYGVEQGLNGYIGAVNTIEGFEAKPQLEAFPLENIDKMRMDILGAINQESAFIINENTYAPYGNGLGKDETWDKAYKLNNQEGLALKTYQSDLFNNFINTDWIEGDSGINEVASVSTVGDKFTIDALNIANKIYNILNRIAISDGTYDAWLDAVFSHERSRSVENPVYHGSLIKELAFQEVISNADVQNDDVDNPLGTLAGRGVLTQKHKGGQIKIKVSEPCYIMGIVSITPRIDYSQGNKWDTNLKTMDDFHKPGLSEIGFQGLITGQMAWFGDETDENGNVEHKQAGKQPAWINYMTNVNEVKGAFAEQRDSMFMVLNRRYEQTTNGIADLTTYVDPSKFNHIFAQTKLDSQNFWVQINKDVIARRKMSAKVIPNL